MTVADPSDSVFSPAIRARPRMLVRKILPRSPVRAVILADRAPLPFGKIRPPSLPVFGVLVRFVEALFFRCHRNFSSSLRPYLGENRGKVRQATSIDRTVAGSEHKFRRKCAIRGRIVLSRLKLRKIPRAVHSNQARDDAQTGVFRNLLFLDSHTNPRLQSVTYAIHERTQELHSIDRDWPKKFGLESRQDNALLGLVLSFLVLVGNLTLLVGFKE